MGDLHPFSVVPAACWEGPIHTREQMGDPNLSSPPGGGGTFKVVSDFQRIAAQTNERVNRVRAAAAEYIACNFKLCAIANGSKGPNYENWQKEPRSLDNIGYHGLGLIHALSRTCAIDVDDLESAEGWLSLHGIDLRDLLGADDAVQIVSGRANRRKLLYRLPPGVDPLITKQIKSPDGAIILEFRCAADGSAGCQDVLPPSIHPKTKVEYQWAGAGNFKNLPFLPAPLLKIWREENNSNAPRRGRTNNAPDRNNAKDVIVEGSRNDTLFKRAGDLFRLGLAYESVLAAVMAENKAKCSVPLPISEVEALVRSARDNSHGGKEITEQQALDAATRAAADAATKEAADQVDPSDFVAMFPRVLQDIAVWYVQRAVMPQPAFKVAIALAAAGAVLARDFTGAGGAFTHLYCVLIGPPGSGKEAALRSVKDIVAAYDASRLPGNPASDTGALTALMRDPASCFVMDELGEVLKGIFDSKAAGHKAAIGTTFLELYSKGGTQYFGREYAKQTGLDGRARVDIYSPCPRSSAPPRHRHSTRR